MREREKREICSQIWIIAAACDWKIGGCWWHREQMDETACDSFWFSIYLEIFIVSRHLPAAQFVTISITYRPVRSTGAKSFLRFPCNLQTTELQSLPSLRLLDISKSELMQRQNCQDASPNQLPFKLLFAARHCFRPQSCRTLYQGNRCDPMAMRKGSCGKSLRKL